MTSTMIISILTSAGIFVSVIKKPSVTVHIGKGKRTADIGLYWLISLAGAALLLIFGAISPSSVWAGMTGESAVNPLKILTLFISMTAISVFLDEAGLFRYLAVKSLSRASGSQKRFFITMYLLVSVLTVFTSNDIVILTFTPFLCYYAKHAGIDPVPYLIGEFVAANSLSLTLLIGNPTNIYIASAYGIGFGEYFTVMWFPALLAGAVGFIMTYIIFRKKLSLPISPAADEVEVRITDKPLLTAGISILVLCTVLLALSSYLGFEIWSVSLCSAAGLLLFAVIYSFARRRRPNEVLHTLARCPWELIPFVLSMFVIVLALNEHNVTRSIGESLDFGVFSILSFGITAFLFANIINNIPMSVLFASALSFMPSAAGEVYGLSAVYAVITASNIGAFLTPVGALAGIMWLGILKKHEVKFGFGEFVKYGLLISVPTLLASLGGLYISLM